MKPWKSVAFKLSVLTSFMVLGVIGLMARRIFKAAEDRLIGEMTVRAEFFARSTREALFPRLDAFSLHFHVEEMLKEKAVVYAAVLDPAGKVLSHSRPELIGETLGDPFTKRALAADAPLLQRVPTPAGAEAYDLAAPVLVGTRRVGTARIGFDQSSLEDALREQRRELAVVAAIAVGIAILGTLAIVGWITRPLPLLAAAAREVGRGNFAARVEWRSGDEIGTLARAFNDMAVANSLLFTTLREEKSKLETIFNGAQEGIVLLNPRGQVVLANAAARALLDWREDGPQTLADALRSANFEANPPLTRLLDAGNQAPFELKRSEPKLLILSGLADGVGDTNAPAGHLLIFRNATVEKRGETLARSFLSLVSHKLRTPLAVALGFLEILEGDADLKPFHKKAVAKIRQEDDKLRHLVEKLIMFSTVQSPDSIVLERGETTLGLAVEIAIKALEDKLKNADLQWDPNTPAAQAKLSADSLMLKECVLNLIENALKFNKSDDKLVKVAVERRDGFLRLTVGDNGPGIPSEEQPKLFRRFYQIDDDFTGQIPGFGLGLAFVKNAVEAHGGRVGVDSAPGTGSAFWFEVPVS